MTNTGEKPYDCRYCDQGFSQSQSAKIQERTHNEEKPYDDCRIESTCYISSWRKEAIHMKFVAKDLTWLNNKHIANLLFMQRNHSNIQIVVTDLEIWVLWKDLHILGKYQKYCNTSYDQNVKKVQINEKSWTTN